MKRLLKFLVCAIVLLGAKSVSAQTTTISSWAVPAIQKGDTVLVYFRWNDENSERTKVEWMDIKDLCSPDSTNLKEKRLAVHIYPEATRLIAVRTKRSERTVGVGTFFQTIPEEVSEKVHKIIVVDENGNEIRDEYSDVVGAPLRFKKLDITNMTDEEIVKKYYKRHPQIKLNKSTNDKK